MYGQLPGRDFNPCDIKLLLRTDRILKKFYVSIFEYQLAEWWTREDEWPTKRDYRTFMQWFDLEFHSVVDDLVDAPLFDD